MRRILVICLLATWALGLAPAAPGGAGVVIEPDLFQDGYGNGPGCTLREAIRAANLDTGVDYCKGGSGADTILLEKGTYSLSLPGAGEDQTLSGDLDITGDLWIQGVGMDRTIIDATGLGDRVFELLAGNLMLADLTIKGGQVSGGDGTGGGIRQSGGTLTLQASRVTGNRAETGGGVHVTAGPLTIRGSVIDSNAATFEKAGGIRYLPEGSALYVSDSEIRDNTAAGSGGGIVTNSSDARFERMLIAGNTAGAGGVGGIWNTSVGSMRMNDSTFHGNSSPDGQGAIRTDGPATLTNLTIADNPAGSLGVAIGAYGAGATIAISNSVLDNGGANCAVGGMTSGGGNLEDASTCPFTAATDRRNTDPKLAPLAANGGPTMTRALRAGSPAIGRGSGCSATDQRGAPRSGACESGAYELLLCRRVPVNILGTPFLDVLTGTPQADAILAFAGNDVIFGGGGNDRICGGPGRDQIRGGRGNDRISGQGGNDNLLGGRGSDLLNGGGGSDRCRQGRGQGVLRSCER